MRKKPQGLWMVLTALVGALFVAMGTLPETEQGIGQQDSTRMQERPVTEDSPQQMEVHFLDVGQADATLVISGNHAMLIDTGTRDKGTAIQNYLQKQGIEKLDYLILTHPDADHIGAAAVVITKFEIGQVFMSDFEKDNRTYRNLLETMDSRRVAWSTPEVGDTYHLGSAEFTLVAPHDTYGNPNDASLGILLENGENSFLFTGDAGEAAEKDMVDSGISLEADVYQAGHHGSNTSSSQVFLDEVKPEFAVISCGEGNSYGHPRAETLNAFRSRGIQVFRTDEQGTVIAESDGKEITWNTAPSDTWKAGEPTGE